MQNAQKKPQHYKKGILKTYEGLWWCTRKWLEKLP